MPHFTFCFSRDGKEYVHSVAFKAESFGAAMDAVKAIDGVEPVSLREAPEWHWTVRLVLALVLWMQAGLFIVVMGGGAWNASSSPEESTHSWIIIGLVALSLFIALGASWMIRARHAKKAGQTLAEMVAAAKTPEPTFPTLERMGWRWFRFMPFVTILLIGGTFGRQAVAAVLDAPPEQLKGIQSVFLITVIASAATSMIGSDTLWRGARKKSQAAG